MIGGIAVYKVDSIANATDYHWTLPTGVTASAGENTNTITLNFGSAATGSVLSVIGSNACSSGVISEPFILEIPEKAFILYPVPSNGVFTAGVSFPAEATFTINVYDHLGSKIMEIDDAKTVGGVYTKEIDLGSIANGFYLVEFVNGTFREVRKLLINR